MMDRGKCGMYGLVMLGIVTHAIVGGCHSPHHADRGALFGGLLGAGTGAIVGDAMGNSAAGAAVGAGVGALSGAVFGNELDRIEAQNRDQIAAQMGHQIRPGATSMDDVIMMSRAGVDEVLMVNHIQANGVRRVPSPVELVQLKEQGVPVGAIRAMQEVGTSPPQPTRPIVIRERVPSSPIFVEDHLDAPCWHGPRHRRHYRHAPHSNVSWGFSFHR